MMLKHIIRTSILTLAVAAVVTSCDKSPEHPGYIYFPDMTYSQAYETMTPNELLADSQTQQLAVYGAIPRGFQPFHYENNISDYARSAEELTNPLESTEEQATEGKYFYDIYCAICHGEEGEGNGHIVTLEKFPAPPSYFNDYMLSLEDGKMFYSIHYGKGLMGSYASQLTQEERWKVIVYINQLQDEYLGADSTEENAGESTDTTAAVEEAATAMIN